MGRFGRTGCILFVGVLTAIMTIAFLIGVTRPSGEAAPTVFVGATFAATSQDAARPSSP